MKSIAPGLLLLLLFNSCSSNKIEVKVQNESAFYLDSLIVFINNYKFKIVEIHPYSTLTKKIPKDSINTNPHDISVRVSAHDKNNTKFKGGFYYNDLFMPNQSAYAITLTKDSNILIQ